MSCMRGRVRRSKSPVIHAYLNPLVKWVWLGGAIVVMGTFVALLPNRRTVLVLAGSDAACGCDGTWDGAGAVAWGYFSRGT